MTPAAAQTHSHSHRGTSATPLNVYLCPPVINASFEGSTSTGGGGVVRVSGGRSQSGWGGGETQDGTRGEEGDVVSKVIDGWSQTERYYLRRLGDLWPHKTLCEDNSSHICFETKRARDRESEGQRERERSWGRGVFVKDKRLVSTIIRERERETLPADWLSTSSVFRLYLYSYRNLSRKT